MLSIKDDAGRDELLDGFGAVMAEIKVGVKKEGGPPPGYRWNVYLIDETRREATRLFNDEGREHLAMQVKELARHDDPTHSQVLDIRPIENFHELRDGGAFLGGANVRLFFGVDHENRAIIPIGVIKKQNNGPTPQGDKVTMRRRWRIYLKGGYGPLPS